MVPWINQKRIRTSDVGGLHPAIGPRWKLTKKAGGAKMPTEMACNSPAILNVMIVFLDICLKSRPHLPAKSRGQIVYIPGDYSPVTMWTPCMRRSDPLSITGFNIGTANPRYLRRVHTPKQPSKVPS